MEIRKANLQDLEQILKIYEYARRFMAETGNPTQWGNHYPEKNLLIEDIEKDRLFVVCEQGRVRGVFVFLIGEDPTYQIIEDGAWPNDALYGTIHRIAGDGEIKGLVEMCVEYCSNLIDNLRIDTHHDNKIMQYVIEKSGFKRCGIIYADDGSPRIAYQKICKG